MGIPNYDSWKLRSREDEMIIGKGKPVHHCEYCENALFIGDEAIEDTEENLIFCNADCFNDYQHEVRALAVTIGDGDW